MKNLILPILLLISSSSVFASNIEQEKNHFTFGIYDMSKLALTGEAILLSTSIITRHNTDSNLCWGIVGKDLPNTVKTVETFISPAKAVFSSADSKVKSNKNGTQHTITKKRETIKLDNSDLRFTQSCWSFSPEDPIGDYTLTVTINDISYPIQHFTLTD